MSDALTALSNYAAEQNRVTDHDLGLALENLKEVAAPWNALERFTRWRRTARKPGKWIHLVHECAVIVRANPQLNGTSRRALGEARKSLREPVAVGPALLSLRDQLRART